MTASVATTFAAFFGRFQKLAYLDLADALEKESSQMIFRAFVLFFQGEFLFFQGE